MRYFQVLAYIYLMVNLQPEYELPSSTCFGQFRKFGKLVLGHRPLQPPPRKQLGRFMFHKTYFLLWIDVDGRCTLCETL